MKITLPNNWYRYVKHITELQLKSANYRKTHKGWTDDWFETDVNAFAAEFATAYLTNRWWSGWIAIGYPDVWPNIDVKQTHHANGRLIVETEKLTKYPDRIYVLAIGQHDEYDVVGYESGHTLLAWGHDWQLKGPPSKSRTQDELRNINDLILPGE